MTNLGFFEIVDGKPVVSTVELYILKCEKCGLVDENLDHKFCANCGSKFESFETTKEIPKGVKLYIF